jgi:hypothetical protein
MLVLVFMLNLVPSSWAQTTSAPFMRTDLSIVVDIAVGGKIRHFLLDTGCGLTVASADTAGWSPVDVMKAAPTHIIVWVDGFDPLATRSDQQGHPSNYTSNTDNIPRIRASCVIQEDTMQ